MRKMLCLILRHILSVVVVGLMAVSLLVFANRKPRIMNYSINDDGISIGGKHYAYDFFRSFSVIKEGGVDSIVIDPMQRFLPPITMYFAPEDASHIVEVLSRHIPHEDKTPDIVDRFARRIRF